MEQLINSLFTGAETHIFSGWLFLRLLGCIYAIAFGSLAVQVRGLFGKNGLAPSVEHLAEQAAIWGKKRCVALPTGVGCRCSDGDLRCACGSGVALSLLLII